MGILRGSRDIVRAIARSCVLLACLVASSAQALVISEFRLRGPTGSADEFIEIYNNTNADATVAATDGSAGYAVVTSTGVVRFIIPNGTVIPARGHFLGANITYSLGATPAGNGTTATADATWATDIADNSGIAIFSVSNPVNFILANRLDAVGFTTSPALYREGAGLPTILPFSIDYSFVRDACGKLGVSSVVGPCPRGGVALDTDNNVADFYFTDTNGTFIAATQRLAAPGPENLSSPVTINPVILVPRIDPCVASNAAPNFVRDTTPGSGLTSSFGTVDIRHTFVNTTGANLTRLRFRIVDITTFPAVAGFSDMRAITSVATTATVDRLPCGTGTSVIPVQGTTLENPPAQPNGGAWNSTFSVPAVTLGTPLPNGGSIDLRFVFGLQQTGFVRVALLAEGLPHGDVMLEFFACSDGCPNVVSSVRASADPTSAGSVQFTVTFSEAVTGVDAADFALTTTGVAGATVTSVTGSGTTYTVTVGTGTGAGTLRLDVIDNDTIANATLVPLGGVGMGNGNFTTGEAYTVVAPPFPSVVSSTRVNPSPTAAASVQYTVTFSQAVTGVDTTDFALTTTGVTGASVTGVSGSGTTYTVTVGTGTGSGTIRLDVVDDDTIVNAGMVPLGGAGAGNGNFTTGEVYAVDRALPTVTINQAGAQADPTSTSPINFTVTFSEAVTGFTAADVQLSGTALATTAVVTGGATVYNVAVSGMTVNGTVIATIPAGGAADSLGNVNAASTSTDNTVTFGGIVSTSFSGPTATGTGTETASFVGGGPTCGYSLAQLIGPPPGAPPIPPVGIPGIVFPHGLFNFVVSNCIPGSALVFTLTYPQALAPGTQYYKYGPTAAIPAPHWYVLPAVIAGNTAVFTIVDGGLGDDDLAANGTIVDQGGPGSPGVAAEGVTRVPTMSAGMLALLALLLVITAGYMRRRS